MDDFKLAFLPHSAEHWPYSAKKGERYHTAIINLTMYSDLKNESIQPKSFNKADSLCEVYINLLRPLITNKA